MDNAWHKLVELKETAISASLEDRQWSWLEKCLHRNSDTEYGRQHGFSSIKTIADYQSRVPIINFEDIAGCIDCIATGDKDVLFSGLPIAFESTGGSTSGPKLIPYTQSSLNDFNSALMPWLIDTIEQYDLNSGCAYWSISPATRVAKTTTSGIAIGLPDSAYLGNEALESFANLSAIPFWVSSIQDVKQWRVATLYWLLVRDDLTLISIWSPSFFLHLMDGLEFHADELNELLENGGEIAGNQLMPDHCAQTRLGTYLSTSNAQALWPRLKLVSCWADASSKSFFRQLQQRLSFVQFQAKGLLATEGVVTVPKRNGNPILAADCGFYEFLDSKDGVHLAHELEDNKDYEVIMTTSGGLYRYRIGDQVHCHGWMDDVPRLEFIGRRGHVSDLVGEKLTDSFVSSCLKTVDGFGMLFAQQTPTPHYVLVVDADHRDDSKDYSELVDECLCINPQYEYARRIGQLGSVKNVVLRRPLARFLEWGVSRGRLMGDIKVPALCLEAECLPYMSKGVQ